MMTPDDARAIAAGYRSGLACGCTERCDAPNDTAAKLDAAGGPLGDRARRDRQQYLHIDADCGLGFGHTGL